MVVLWFAAMNAFNLYCLHVELWISPDRQITDISLKSCGNISIANSIYGRLGFFDGEEQGCEEIEGKRRIDT